MNAGISDALQVVWLLLIGGVANISPVLFRSVPFLHIPVDFGAHDKKGNRILGDGKTWRGIFFGSLCAGIVSACIEFCITKYILEKNTNAADLYNAFVIGVCIGCSALAGDIVKSFIKRRVGIQRGVSWVPWDQIDWTIGIMVFMSLLYFVHGAALPYQYWLIIPIGFFLHLITKWIGWLLKLEPKPL